MGSLEGNTPKHRIVNSEAFQKGREQMGNLILKNMAITGGTDVDWIVERKGNFIVIEAKQFRDNQISIPLGQMIAFENLHERLSSGGQCFFYIFASDEDTDWKNPESTIWYFEMERWKKGLIPTEKIQRVSPDLEWKGRKLYIIKKESMYKIPIKDFRALMESHWKEFEKKIDLNPKLKDSTFKISKIEKAHVIKEIPKTYPNAYEKWTVSDDEFLKRFWKENKQTRKEKIRELMKKFGRNRGAITSRLKQKGLHPDGKYP